MRMEPSGDPKAMSCGSCGEEEKPFLEFVSDESEIWLLLGQGRVATSCRIVSSAGMS